MSPSASYVIVIRLSALPPMGLTQVSPVSSIVAVVRIRDLMRIRIDHAGHVADQVVA